MGRSQIVRLRPNKRDLFCGFRGDSCRECENGKNELANFKSKSVWPVENAVSMEIRKKRGFPQILAKVSQKAARLSHISHRPYWSFFF
jgi:hypothetical protein